MGSDQPIHLSVFELLSEQLYDTLPVVTYTKATLVHLSHALEDIVLRERLPALLFTGFQRSSYWQQETERYTQLAKVAQQVTVFAGERLPPEQLPAQLHVTLDGDDPLRQEWFLVILSAQFSVILCGQDNLSPVMDEGLREFNTLWSFEPEIVNRVLDTLETIVARYRPERVATLRQARRDLPPVQPNSRLMTHFMLDILRFEEQLSGSLRRERERFQQIADTISHQIYVRRVDAANTILETDFLSHNIERLTGYPREHFQQDDRFLYSLVLPEDQALAFTHIDQLTRGVDNTVEYRIRHRDGHTVWIQDTGRVRYDPLSRDMMIYGVLHDITRQRQAEITLREHESTRLQLAQERRMNAIRGRFMTTVSHEFRTPLATILSSAESLLRYFDRMPQDKREHRLETIRDQVLHLREMLDDINYVMDSESGGMTCEPVATDLRGLAGDALGRAASSTEADHHLTLSFTGENRPVMADPRLVRRILDNLLGNAIKYSPPDTHIRLNLTLEQDRAVFRVEDEGFGIPEADQAHLFEAFYRGSNTNGQNGTGLGLKIAQDSAELHGGSIHFTSEVDRGTTFYVALPVQPVPTD